MWGERPASALEVGRGGCDGEGVTRVEELGGRCLRTPAAPGFHRGTPGTRAASDSRALKNLVVATSHTLPCPTFLTPRPLPDLAQWGCGVGGAVAWAGGGVPCWIFGWGRPSFLLSV